MNGEKGRKKIEDEEKIFTAVPEEILRNLKQGIVVITPQVTPSGVFLGLRKDDTWGEKGPKSWVEAGPPWVQSGGELWRPDEELIDFGGKLTPEMAIELAQKGARIIKGSVEEERWRIAVPEGSLKEITNLLINSKVDFVKHTRPKKYK